jgi:hypothetical protein
MWVVAVAPSVVSPVAPVMLLPLGAGVGSCDAAVSESGPSESVFLLPQAVSRTAAAAMVRMRVMKILGKSVR